MRRATRPAAIFAFLFASPLGPAAAPAEGFVLNAAQCPTVRCSTGAHAPVHTRRPITGCWGTFSTGNTAGTRRRQPRGICGGLGGSATGCSSTSIGSMHIQVQSGTPARCNGSSRRGSGGRTRRDAGSLSMSASIPGKEHAESPPVGLTAVSAEDFKSHKRAAHRVIFMRHGECEWNRDNRFLGWADIGLTEKGEMESRKAAQTLLEFGITVDEIYCSYLKRSIKSAWILADELDQAWMPVHTDWRLNEQMYGALQGLNKRATAERFGTKLTQQWRRSYDIAPPARVGGRGYFPPGDPKYAALTEDDIPASWCGSPNTESLKDAQARSWLFWRERVVPALKADKTVMICGHGNIIRSLLKRLDNIPKNVLKQISIPRGTPLVYEFDENLVTVGSPSSLGPLRGRFLCNPITLAKALQQESIATQLGSVSDADSVDHVDTARGGSFGLDEEAAERVENALGHIQ